MPDLKILSMERTGERDYGVHKGEELNSVAIIHAGLAEHTFRVGDIVSWDDPDSMNHAGERDDPQKVGMWTDVYVGKIEHILLRENGEISVWIDGPLGFLDVEDLIPANPKQVRRYTREGAYSKRCFED